MDRLNKIGMSHSDPAAGKILGLMFKYRPSLRRGHGTADTRHTYTGQCRFTVSQLQQYFCLCAEDTIIIFGLELHIMVLSNSVDFTAVQF